MSETGDDELRLAELAATEGPTFALWRLDPAVVRPLLAELTGRGVRHAVAPDGDLVVHRNDAEPARAVIARVADVSFLEVPAAPRPGSQAPGPLVTVYTAGSMHQAHLVLARLRAADIDAVLAYDAALGVAPHLVVDSTVAVRVRCADRERAVAELDGDELDRGSELPFASQAWATPMRRAGARSLLVVMGVWLAPVVVLLVGLAYGLVAP